ncbi:hypothetical protein, partial [Rodentibacter pneumotropicus]|uniref:hypothetical protein n=1 Tax=Rodentibacter pneumotropicus TaxID=758 RepID=UPI001F454CDB
VKRCNADGSVGFPHVRVGHRQVLLLRNPLNREIWGILLLAICVWSRGKELYRDIKLIKSAVENLAALFISTCLRFYPK